MQKRRVTLAIAAAMAAAGFLVSEQQVGAAPPLHVGHAVRVVNAVDCEIPQQSRRRMVEAEKVFFDENVFTTESAKAVLQFRDGSTLEIGPDAVVTVDELVFNPKQGRSGKVMSVLRGTFRYVSAYAAPDSDVTIRTPTGNLGIRGSVVSGIVHSQVPVFVHVASGQAVFENDGGQIDLASGNAIAVPERRTAPMSPQWMPVGVAAEAIGHIESTLGPIDGLPAAQAVAPQQRQEDARANALPVGDQQTAAGGAGGVVSHASGGAPPPLSLLAEGQGLGLYAGNSGANPSAEQQNFIARTERAFPEALTFITGVTEAQQRHEGLRRDQGAMVVVTGLSEIAQSPQEIATIVETAAAHHPAGAVIVARAAVEAGRLNPVIGGDSGVLAETVAVSAARSAPGAAHEVAAQVAGLVPEAAVRVAQSVSKVVPNRSREIVYGVAGAVPEAAAELGVQNWTGGGQAPKQGGGWQPIQ